MALRRNGPAQKHPTQTYSYNKPGWYEDMSDSEKQEYASKLPKSFSMRMGGHNYKREVENKGWVMFERDGEVYFTNPEYKDKEFASIEYSPGGVRTGEYLPYIKRNEDVRGLGYNLVTHDGVFSRIESNEWTKLSALTPQ